MCRLTRSPAARSAGGGSLWVYTGLCGGVTLSCLRVLAATPPPAAGHATSGQGVGWWCRGAGVGTQGGLVRRQPGQLGTRATEIPGLLRSSVSSLPFFSPQKKRKIINFSEVVAIPRLALAPMAWLVSGHLAPEAEGRPGGSPRSPQWSLGLEVTRRRDWWLSLTQPVGAREGWAELRELREPWGGKTGQSAISRAGPSASESPKCKRDNIPAAEGSWPLARRGF